MARKWWKAFIPKAPRGTLRPQNRCSSCGHSWYPRGTNSSPKCPNCGVRFRPEETSAGDGCASNCLALGCLIVVLGGGVLAVCGGIASYVSNRGSQPGDGPPAADLTKSSAKQNPAPGGPTRGGEGTEQSPAPRPKRPAAEPPAALAVAPMPRVVPAPRPPDGWASDWKQIGQVKARVRAVCRCPVPTVDRKGKRSLRTDPADVVWLEFAGTGPAARTLARYQQSDECVLRDSRGVQQVAARLPLGSSFDDPLPFYQPIPTDGGSVVNVVAFDPDAAATDPRTISLDASRVGESGRFVFTIPASAWRR